MDGRFSGPEEQFRLEVREWLRANVPGERRPSDPAMARSYDVAWQWAQFDGGWAGISWPAQHGGRELSLLEQMIWYEECALAHAPVVGVNFVGLNHAGPTLIARGDDSQQQAHLPRILRGDEIWCQGFSEPNAGSDLASLTTRGVVDGDDLVVNGSKIWTSYGNVADFQELLVRTNTDVPKHKGITWVICDMRSEGIDVRPIRAITGNREFCEVFYQDVRIPLKSVVGQVDGGWSVAMSTLSFERGTAYASEQIELAQIVDSLVQAARSTVGPDGRRAAILDDEIASRLATVQAEVLALRALTYLSISRAAREVQPGPEGSIVRLFFAELKQRVYRLAVDVLGIKALNLGQGETWPWHYLNSFARTIGAGTKDIQRNVIGERVLGLPRDSYR